MAMGPHPRLRCRGGQVLGLVHLSLRVAQALRLVEDIGCPMKSLQRAEKACQDCQRAMGGWLGGHGA